MELDSIIFLSNDKLTFYEAYIAVQDILTQTYFELREAYAKTVLGKLPKDLRDDELKTVRAAYPFKLSEIEVK